MTGFGCLFVITTDTLELAVIADAVAQGNMRELRNQVISSYKTITRYLFSNKINQNNIRIPVENTKNTGLEIACFISYVKRAMLLC